MAYQFKNASILIVEDNKPMGELLRSILSTFGFQTIHTATNGREGFKIFCDYAPDIVLADWMMKPVNGITLARMIRTDKRSPNRFTPVILMTGFSERRRVFQARDAGITEFMVKPFQVDVLYKRLEQIIENPRQFVDCTDFFGPDRRRKRPDPAYDGPFRRITDALSQEDFGIEDSRDLALDQNSFAEALNERPFLDSDIDMDMDIELIDRA